MRNFISGDVLQCFKRQLVQDTNSKEYLYQYIGIAENSETNEKMVIYKALYGEKKTWVQPYKMFMGKVDKIKYPQITQEYRFEKYYTKRNGLKKTFKRNDEYEKLCQYVHDGYRAIEIQNAQQNMTSKSIFMTGCEFNYEINLWTYWQGRGVTNPKIMLIGQDWGSLEEVGLEKRIELCKNQPLLPNEDDRNLYFTGCDINKLDFKTDQNLGKLFASLEMGYENIMNKRYDDLYFTNICLGYRSTGYSGGFKMSWITDVEKYVYPKLVELLAPKVIICLGKDTYAAFLKSMGLKDKRDKSHFNQFIETNNRNPFMIKDIPVFSFAHCGALGTINRGDNKTLSLQISDWSNIKRYL